MGRCFGNCPKSRAGVNPMPMPLWRAFSLVRTAVAAQSCESRLRARDPAKAIQVTAKATIVQATLVATCLAGMTACVTTQTYYSVKQHGWTRDSIEEQFPAGTDRKKVFAQMGSPFRELSVDGATWWIYSGGGAGKDQVAFIFRNGKLVETRFGTP